MRAHPWQDSVLFGSALQRGDITLPRSSPHLQFASQFLDRLRGISRTLAPDIIDFRQRAIYEIKTPDFAADGARGLEHLQRLADAIHHELGGTPFLRHNARWSPEATMFLPGHRNHLVCTELTNAAANPGLITYTVWAKS